MLRKYMMNIVTSTQTWSGSRISICAGRSKDFFFMRYRGCERRARGRSGVEASLEGFLLPPEAANVLITCH